MTIRPCLPPLSAPSRPRTALPPGTVDCHCHVFADPAAYPLTPARSYEPAPASLADYLAACERLGIARTVQVNASVYGFDNSLTLDIIRELGQKRARGVAGVAPDIGHAELARLHEGGFRGARLSTTVEGYGGTDMIEALAERLRPFGWHLQLHFKHAGEMAELEARLMRVPVPLVIDHMGGVRGPEGAASPGFQALLRLLANREDCWTKISSWYRRSAAGPPDYRDMKPIVQALASARPDRLVFGTNWPHPSLFAPEPMPDDGALVDLFCDWIPDAALRRRICVDNPERLYAFDS